MFRNFRTSMNGVTVWHLIRAFPFRRMGRKRSGHVSKLGTSLFAKACKGRKNKRNQTKYVFKMTVCVYILRNMRENMYFAKQKWVTYDSYCRHSVKLNLMATIFGRLLQRTKPQMLYFTLTSIRTIKFH